MSTLPAGASATIPNEASSLLSLIRTRTVVTYALLSCSFPRLEMRSAYAAVGDPITNWTLKFKGCLDYIWVSKSVPVTALLEPVTADTHALQMVR